MSSSASSQRAVINLYKGCQVLADNTMVADVKSQAAANATKLLGTKAFLLTEVDSWLDAIENLRLSLSGDDECSSDSDHEEDKVIWLPFKATDKEKIISKPSSTKTVAKNIKRR